jgi:hypothetical protein
MSNEWDHIAYKLLRLVSPTQNNVIKIHPNLSPIATVSLSLYGIEKTVELIPAFACHK